MITAVAFLFSLHSRADDNPSNATLEWAKNRWMIKTLEFSRWRGENITDPFPSLSGHFCFYYNKMGPCNTSTLAAIGPSSRLDPELCGIDLETSKIPTLCRMCNTRPGQTSLLGGKMVSLRPSWLGCSGRNLGRYFESEECKGKTQSEKLKGVEGCIYKYVDEGESERPWVKWRVVAFNQGFSLFLDSYNNPSNLFRSIVYEIVVGQRFVPHRIRMSPLLMIWQIFSRWEASVRRQDCCL
jgi:hypothetical protein